MSEPTLAAAYTDLVGDVSFFLGWGRVASINDTSLSSQQQASLDRCLKGGLRKVYHCGYPWSFLHPVSTLAIDSGKNTVALPDDFGGVEGEITVSASSVVVWHPVEFGPVGRVYQVQAREPSTTGRPQLACVEPLKGTTGSQGQRFQLRFWPLADGAYTLQFAYYLNPDYLSGAFPYLYGGAQHAECFLAACKATAELDLDDEPQGPQQMEFARLLEISKELDRRNKPQTFGLMTDRSDALARRNGAWWHTGARVSVNGVIPG